MDQGQRDVIISGNDKTAASDVDSYEGVAAVNGVHLRYVCRGNGSHPVLMIPAAFGTPELHYKHQLDYLGREGSGFKLVSFEPRGCGTSCNLKRGSYSTDAKDGYELMLSLSLPTFSVFGWCDGGIVGMMLASLYPQAVRDLVILCSRSYITAKELEFCEQSRDVSKWEGAFNPVRMYGVPTLSRIYSNWLDSIIDYYNNGGDICTGVLPLISCPTLIVHGAKDEMCPLFHGEYIHDHVTGSRLVVMEHGRHMLLWKHHQEFNKILEDFLNERLIIKAN